MTRYLNLSIVVILASCGGGTDTTDESTDARVDTTCAADCMADCDALSANLSAEIDGSARGCTAIVRLAFDTYAPTNWTLVCGPYTEVSEAQARITAKAEVDYGVNLAGVAPGDAINPPDPTDAYVFAVPPADFGGFSVVSARTGLLLLGGRLNWSGPANLLYPSAWRDQTQLGAGCQANVAMPSHRIYDFAGDSLDPTQADVEKVLNVISKTALPSAFTKNGVLSDVVLVRLQRTVDGSSMATSTSEWVVLLNGGAPN